MVSLISPPSPTCSQMEGLKEVVGHLLGTFPIPLMERAVMAATACVICAMSIPGSGPACTV